MSPEEESKLIEIGSRWKWICELLNGEKVSDFALSFWEVRMVDDIMAPWRELKALEEREEKP